MLGGGTDGVEGEGGDVGWGGFGFGLGFGVGGLGGRGGVGVEVAVYEGVEEVCFLFGVFLDCGGRARSEARGAKGEERGVSIVKLRVEFMTS